MLQILKSILPFYFDIMIGQNRRKRAKGFKHVALKYIKRCIVQLFKVLVIKCN